MKKVIAMLLTVALTAALSIGATLAYLTDTDEDVNVMTLGKVKIDQLEYERIDPESKDDDAAVQEFHDNKPLLPAVIDKEKFQWETTENYVDWEQIGKDGYTSGIWNPDEINNEVDKMVFVKNKGDYDAYVRSVFAFEAGKYETLDEYLSKVHLNLNTTDWTWEWVETPVTIGESKYFVATATYNKVLKPGELTEISLGQIALDPSATNEDVESFGDTYQVLVKSQAIQTEGFDSPTHALNGGFGAVAATNIPWENDSPIKGIDLRTALHYYEGDKSNQITAKVTNVIFGLNKDYSWVLADYDGTLVDVEQDVNVYAYYVPTSGGYDVYFLADDVVYTPRNSNALFKDMTALQTVNTYNMDVSRTEDMYEMFCNCRLLQNMDMSSWDTGSATNMHSMFRECDTMTQIDASGWNVEKVEDLYTFISFCDKLEKIDLTGWNLSSACDASWMLARNPELLEVDATDMKTTGVTSAKAMFQNNFKMQAVHGTESWSFPNALSAAAMFEYCYKLQSLNAANWDLGNCQSTTKMFSTCESLTAVSGSGNWDLGNVTDASYMFQLCYSLPYLDATNWDMGSCKNACQQFMSCLVMETVEGTENWDTSNIENMQGMFIDNQKMVELDVSTWDTGSVTTMKQMFRDCYELLTLDVADWDVSNVTDFSGMFTATVQNSGDMKLQYLDVSKWNTASATTFRVMFYGCGDLKEVDMSNWDTSNVETVHHMFTDCYSLEKVDFTGWETPKLTSMDGMFNNCEALKSVDLSMFDTSNVVYFCQLFEACKSLEEVKGLENWNTAKGTDFSEMFTGTKLTELNLSSFDTSAAKITYSMFYNNSLLKTIYVGDGWDMSNATNHSDMFTGCPSLVGGKNTTVSGHPTDKTCAVVDGGSEAPGYLTHIEDKTP